MDGCDAILRTEKQKKNDATGTNLRHATDLEEWNGRCVQEDA